MGEIINTTTAGPIALTSATQNPLTITATGTITASAPGADGVDGSNLLAWTIVNDGVVTSASGAGIKLLNGGTIDNGLSQGTAAVISGSIAGVFVQGSAGTVVNAGRISGTDGIRLAAGGVVDNRASGTITATGTLGAGFTYGAGVYVAGAAGQVTNDGKITAGGYGIAMAAGGSVTNHASILGTEDGVIVQGASGSVANTGSIIGTVDDGVALFAGGAVTNAAGALISGEGTLGAGVFVTGAAATLNNSGTILGANHIGVLISGGGSLTNAGGALISGDVAGVFLQRVSGEVTNDGSIGATGSNGAGIYVENGGAVTNSTSGVITGTKFGVFLEGGFGILSNSGKILGSTYDGAVLGLGGFILNNAGASIIGGSNGVYGKYRAAADVTNAGSIVGISATGAGIDLGGGGSVTNGSGAAVTGGAFGVFITGAGGTVTNQGRISGTKYDGVALGLGGSVTNAAGALIAGGSNGVYIEKAAAGTVTNAGSITANAAGGAGIDLGAGGTVTNAAGGSIYGTAFGVFATGQPGVVANYGVISGYHGVALEAGGSLTNAAGAAITGHVSGVFSAGAPVTILNAGSITASGVAGLDIEGGGTITNQASAVVSGSAFGVFLTGGDGTITNAGTISGGSYAVKFSGSGNDRLVVDPGAVFAGAVGGGNGTNTLELAAGTGAIAGINTGEFYHFQNLVIDAASTWSLTGGNTAASVTNNGTAVVTGSFGVTSAVSNNGVISSYNGVALGAGGSLTNAAGAAITGHISGVSSSGAPVTIFNAGSISASGAAGLDIEGGGTITNQAGAAVSGSAFGVFLTGGDGTITNAGTISGGSYAVKFSGSGNDRLVVDPGAVFAGAVGGGNGTNTLELAAGTGTIAGINSGEFYHFQNLVVDAASTWSLTGGNTVASMTNDGTAVVNGSLGITSALDPTSTGVFQLSAGSQLDVAAALGTQTQMQFLDGSALAVDNTAAFGTNVGSTSYAGPLLENFAGADKIDLRQFAFSGVSLNYDSAAGLLQIGNQSAQVASLKFQTSSLGTGTFHAVGDGGAGTFITLA